MKEIDLLYKELNLRYGPVLRARKCFLYTKKGIRITDMFQENGKAILGWGNPKPFTQFKNTMNRGITGSFFTEDENRIQKAVSDLLNSKRIVYLFKSKQAALKCALTLSPSDTTFWRPWNPDVNKWDDKSVVIVVPPFAWEEDIYIVAALPEIVEIADAAGKELIASERIAAPYLVGIAHAIYDVISEIPLRKETDWFKYDNVLSKYWTRKGPYLFPKMNEEMYKKFVAHCLDCSILINPEYNNPSIIPFGADIGVFTKLKNNPFDF